MNPDEDLVTIPRRVLELLISAAKHARYDYPVNREQEEIISIYEREYLG